MDFVTWVEKELAAREWSRSDLARKGGLTTAQVSRVLNRQSNPGHSFCHGVAVALGVTPDIVFRRAGILPKETERDEWLRRVEHKLSQIDNDEDRRKVEGLIELFSPPKKPHRRNAEQ